MKRLLLAVGLIASFAQFETVKAQAEPENCCQTCTCIFCASIATCEAGPFSASMCNAVNPGDCDANGVQCTNFWDNNTEGVVTDESVTTYGPGGCIPIDGGLGFLIAGGLGIGVLGIRRREGQHLLERAA